MPELTRRQWLKVGLVLGGVGVFGLSYRDVVKRAFDGLVHGTSGKITLHRIFGNALIMRHPAGRLIRNRRYR